MQKLFFILMGFLSLNNAVAQKANQPYGNAFSILIQPGTIPVDENGIPVEIKINRERFIYVMVPEKNKPTVKTIEDFRQRNAAPHKSAAFLTYAVIFL
ncbi:MAG: hypothetical protein ACKVOM_08160 [Ferruginibacter sp.]